MALRYKKRTYHDFSEELVVTALEDIKKNKLSLRQAQEKYGIPKSTLNRRLNLKHTQRYGRPPVIHPKEEARIAECLSLTAKWGFPLTKLDLKEIVKKALDSKGIEEKRFIDNRPGKKWLATFLKRQEDTLKTRLSHNIKRARAGVTPETIKEYFKELAESLNDVAPEAIINYDETNMQDDPGKTKVIVHRTCKRAEIIKDSSKTGFSVMFAGTASGKTLPVYVVYKSPTNLYHTWMEGGPKDARYNRSKSGWFEGPLFEDWFITVALPYLKKLGEGPKAIIGDNLASHVSVQVLELCIKHNIKFLLLPPNSTHLCQPLDLAYFSPLKQAWRKLLQDYKSKCRGAITKDVFPRKLKEVLAKIEKNSEANLKAGFAASGIYPLDPQRVLNRLPQKENANAELWSENFEEFLKSKRQTETQGIRKRRKVTTIPGKSLSTPEVLEDIKNKKEEQAKKKNQDTPETSGLQNVETSKTKICPRPKVKTIYNLSDSSEDEFDQISLHDTDSDIDAEDFTDLLEARPDAEYARDDVNPDEDQTDKNETEENIPPQKEKTESTLEVGDFVTVYLKYNEGTKKEVAKKFIAKVIKIPDSAEREQNIQLDFLRNYRGSKNVFVFPDIKDILFVNQTQILEKIKPISENRNIYTFNDAITT